MGSSASNSDFEDSAFGNFTYVIAAIWFVLIFTSFLIFIGLSFGIRQAYVHILLKIFEYITSTANDERRAEKEQSSNKESGQDEDALIEHTNPLNEQGLLKFYEEFKPEVRESKELLASLGTIYYVKAGIEAIVDDEVTQRFSAENLQTWNLLTRTHSYQHINIKLTILWGIGFCLRYFLLLPFRISLALSAICGLMIATSFLILVPNKRYRERFNNGLLIFFFRLFMRSFSSVITFHNRENRAKSDGICVANHTSPIDAIVLSCDRSYAMVGQRQGGFMGLMQLVFGSAEAHVWFDRAEIRDRMAVAKRMQAHVEDPDKNPILIFPEGTCINNTSVMMFKKGSFEIGGVIYPVAIKYDSRFADCFWNSSKQGFVSHLLRMMTSWAIVADVWYLPPMKQRDGESAILFAQRVKNIIARQGGLVDLEWDGNLKRSAPKPDLKLKQRKFFSDKILDEEHLEEEEHLEHEEEHHEEEKEEKHAEEEEEEQSMNGKDGTSVVRQRKLPEVPQNMGVNELLHDELLVGGKTERLGSVVGEMAGDAVA